MATNTEKIVVQVVVKGQGELENLKKQTKGTTLGFNKMTAGIVGAVAAFRQINKLVSASVRTFRDFEFQMAKVKAITGASNKDFLKLSKTSQELGRSTFFTAQQVAELQTNFGKLGFSTKEILKAQEATLLLATATDTDFSFVEAVVAHEYFHNWTGNRVTCRDWFQLSLKEGLTVFRDHEFSADMGSRAVTRINDVRTLRQHQFAEDSGPMAHPVRPESYIEINNLFRKDMIFRTLSFSLS